MAPEIPAWDRPTPGAPAEPHAWLLVADTRQRVQIHTKTAQPSLKSRPFAPHPLFAGFIRAALDRRDVDLMRAFLAGKMSVDDAELVRDLIDEGMCAGPVFLPEWFIDIDRLNAMTTHSVTMNRFSLPSVARYYARRKVGRAPAIERAGAPEEADSEDREPAPAADEGDRGE